MLHKMLFDSLVMSGQFFFFFFFFFFFPGVQLIKNNDKTTDHTKACITLAW